MTIKQRFFLTTNRHDDIFLDYEQFSTTYLAKLNELVNAGDTAFKTCVSLSVFRIIKSIGSSFLLLSNNCALIPTFLLLTKSSGVMLGNIARAAAVNLDLINLGISWCA